MLRLMIDVVDEGPEHRAAIAEIHRAAFGGEYEVRIVDRLRDDGLIVVSRVALDDGVPVGHILFSRLAVTVDNRPVPAVSLAPMAVRADRRKQGIGSALIERGLQALRKTPIRAVIVLGHAHYYPRFGFSAALTRHLASPYQGDAFMGLELVPGALAGRTGSVTYPPAFDLT